MLNTKESLLKHYSRREPKSFVQIDGWYGGKWKGDSEIPTDEYGRSMTWTKTEELMQAADMRLLVVPGSDPKEIVALLHKAAHWIAHHPQIVDRTFRWSTIGAPAEIERVRKKLNAALKSTAYRWDTPLGDLVAQEISNTLEDIFPSGELERLQNAEAKFDQYRLSLDCAANPLEDEISL